MRAAVFAVLCLLPGWQVSAAFADDCTVFMTCDKSRCVDVPGNFVQSFDKPKGGVGRTAFLHGNAYIFARKTEVAAAVRSGKVPKDIRYVAYPDEAPTRGRGQWVDAYVMGVQWLSWESGKPTFSKEVSFMACNDGTGG